MLLEISYKLEHFHLVYGSILDEQAEILLPVSFKWLSTRRLHYVDIQVGWTDDVRQVAFRTHPGYLNVLVRDNDVYEPNLWWKLAISKANGGILYILQHTGTTLLELRKHPHGTLAVLYPERFLSALKSDQVEAGASAAQVLLNV